MHCDLLIRGRSFIPTTNVLKFVRLEPLDPGEDSEMEPFDRWTKIRRCFKCILWLEAYHDDLDDLFKGHLGCCSHLILQPKLLNCVSSHVDLYCFEEPSCAQST